MAPWSHFFANFSNIPPDSKKFKGRSRGCVGGAKFSDANLRHFFRKNGGRGFRILVNLGVDIIQGLENRKNGGLGGVWGGGMGGVYPINSRDIHGIYRIYQDFIEFLYNFIEFYRIFIEFIL